MAETIVELLAEHGIRPKRFTPGHNEKLVCPRCAGGSKHEPSLSLTINPDGAGAVWKCHRGTCGWQDGGKIRPDEPRRRREPPAPHRVPTPAPVEQQQRPEWLMEFFAERGISAETVEAFGVYATRRNFAMPIGSSECIVFPYFLDRRLVNRKYRPYPAKNPQLQDQDALPTLFNVDAIEEPDVVVFVEGEPDVMAMHEAGYPQTVSLKDGAPSSANAANDKRFAAFEVHADLLQRAGKFVLAGDMDGPGLALREELARRLGRHRCVVVDWPTPHKDACDVLRTMGAEAVRACVEAATPFPVDGVQRLERGTLVRLRHGALPPLMTTGARATDTMLHLPGEGRLIVITGTPNSGKSSWATFVMIHLMAEHGRRFTVFSPEMQPWEHYAAHCAQVWQGKPFWPTRGFESLTDQEIDQAESWLRERLVMMVNDAEDAPPTLDWMLERAVSCVMQHGTTDWLIDPWNEVCQTREGLTETEFVGRSLQRLRSFALRHGCNVWIIAHPTKPQPPKPGQKADPIGLYDIAGGANWNNKADLGVVVHRLEDATEIHCAKSRFNRWGRKGAKATLEFDPVIGTFRTPITPLATGNVDQEETLRWD